MSGGSTATTTTNQQPPAAYLDAYSKVMGQASNVAGQPYQPYQGSLVAGLVPQQWQGMTQISQAQGAAQPYYNQAGQYFQNANNSLENYLSPYANAAGQYYSNAGNANLPGAVQPFAGAAGGLYTAGAQPITPTQFSAGQVQQYMSPYTQNVINATQQQFNTQNAMQQAALQGNAASQGAIGGDRLGVAQAQLVGQQQMAQAPVIAGLENQGYAQALGEFNTQQQVGTQAQEASRQLLQQAAQGYTGLGTQALTAAQQQAALQAQAGQGYAGLGQEQLGAGQAQGWLAAQTGQGMMGLGSATLGTDLSQANALLQSGALQQQQAQQELNVPYEQYLAAQSYPFQTTGWLANIAEGLGGASGGTSSTTSPGPSTASQLAGGLTSGVGLLGMTGAFNGGSGANATQGWLTGNNGLLSQAGNAISNGWGWLTNAGSAGLAPFAARGGRIQRDDGGYVPEVSPLGLANTPGSQNVLSAGDGVPNIGSVVPGASGLGVAPTNPGTTPYLARNYGESTTTKGGGSGLFGGALSGAGLGAEIGSFIPGIGTLIGAGIGAGVGGLAGGLSKHAGGRVPRFDQGGTIPYGADILIDANRGTVPYVGRTFVPQAPQAAHGLGIPHPPQAVKPDNLSQDFANDLGQLRNMGFGNQQQPGLGTPPQQQPIMWRGGMVRGFADGGTPTPIVGGDEDPPLDPQPGDIVIQDGHSALGDLTDPGLARIKGLPAGTVSDDELADTRGADLYRAYEPQGAMGFMLKRPEPGMVEHTAAAIGDLGRSALGAVGDQAAAVRDAFKDAYRSDTGEAEPAADRPSGFDQAPRLVAASPQGATPDPAYPTIAGGAPAASLATPPSQGDTPPGPARNVSVGWREAGDVSPFDRDLGNPAYAARPSSSTTAAPPANAPAVPPKAVGPGTGDKPAPVVTHPGGAPAGAPGGGHSPQVQPAAAHGTEVITPPTSASDLPASGGLGGSSPGGLGGSSPGGLGATPAATPHPLSPDQQERADLEQDIQKIRNYRPDPWQYVLQAGLGMLGGSSPWAGVNIGRGAQVGLTGYQNAEQKARDLASSVDEKLIQLKDTQAWRDAQAGWQNKKADASVLRAQTDQWFKEYQAANPKLTGPQQNQNAAEDAVRIHMTNPFTGEPFQSVPEALAYFKNTAATTARVLEGARHDQVGENIQERRLQMQVQKMQQDKEYQDKIAAWHTAGLSETESNNITKLAAQIRRDDLTMKTTPAQAMDQALEMRRRAGAAIPPALGGAAPAAQPSATPGQTGYPASPPPPHTPEMQQQALVNAKSAIARGAPRDAIVQEMKLRGYDTTGL